MYGLNIDPNNPRGNPDPAELRELGVEMVRYTYHDPGSRDQLDPDKAGFFSQRVRSYREAGIGSLLILTYDTYPNRPAPDAPDAEWDAYIERFARRAGQIASLLGTWQPAIQVWNEPDHPIHPGYVPTLREAVFGRMLRRTYAAIKNVNPNLKVVAGGLAAGNPDWLTKVIQSLGGDLPADIVAFHPYGQRPDSDWPRPDWGFGLVSTLLNNYYQAGKNKPLWITEMGVKEEDLSHNREQVAEFLRRFYRAITTRHSHQVQQLFWFCYGDGMVPTFGLRDNANNRKPAYQAYREMALTRPTDGTGAPVPPPPTEPIVPLPRLHTFARHLEQSLVFGTRDNTLQSQMNTALKGVQQTLTKAQIQEVVTQTLGGSTFSMSSAEIEALYDLQSQKDIFGTLKSIVLAAHQRTGALTGRLGVHVRISAETEQNANTNIEALARILAHVQSGNRMIVMDTVKAMSDDNKLSDPDVFVSNTYGQHRNGLVDNHAWNLQKLVQAIRSRGFEDRVMLLIRLDGPDGGANVNVFNNLSRQRYYLAIMKMIRYLETMLPATPFKLVLGNEPDLPQERLWSDANADPRAFTVNQFAPAIGEFMKFLARKRPDVTFLCPALSGNLKREYLAYYTAFFGDERLPNLVPCVHGYAGDVTVIPGGQGNLMEQQAEALRALGRFQHVSGTEIGSSNPYRDSDSLSDKGRFADVVMWVMLSVDHRTAPGQDNNWNFRINPGFDDPAARRLADIINRTQARVLRNIREQGGIGLPIMRGQPVDKPAYAVEYMDHNTPKRMIAGQTNAVRLTIRNTGYRTWAADGPNAVRLGYRWYNADGSEVPTTLWADLRTNLPYNLPPDQTATLNANCGAPRSPGLYQVRWDMVEEMITWFAWQGAPTLNVAVTVNPEVITPPPVEPTPPTPSPTPQPPEPPAPAGPKLSASHNNQTQGNDNLLQALDSNPYTRWSTLEPQKPGMWFQYDLGETRPISQIRLNTDRSPRDYPRGYIVKISGDGLSWTTVAEKSLNDQPLNVAFTPRPLRYVRIEQTGSDPIFWWSIHEIEVSNEVKMSVSASHNNVLTGEDNLAQALDGRPDTRWSSRALQTPGMWFEVDLNTVRPVSGLTLDNSPAPSDYPRKYVVRLSTDRQNWQEVSRNDNNDRPLDVSFNPRQARYIRIEQTGSADKWWSIYGLTVHSASFEWSASASHNNNVTGPDNLMQALDGRPETRWSSREGQRPGIWFELDLNKTRMVSGLTLDNARSPQDYPRGYIVRVSTDRNQWVEVAKNERNDRALDISFSPRSVRYIRIEQTGSTDGWWWSIHGITIKA
jgi:hypothetical protein